MINVQTKKEYTGGNLDLLAEAGYSEGDYVLTFKQAMNVFKVTGDMLKGLKGLGTSLFFYKEEINEETGEKEKVRRYFTVFNVKDVERVIQENKLIKEAA